MQAWPGGHHVTARDECSLPLALPCDPGVPAVALGPPWSLTKPQRMLVGLDVGPTEMRGTRDPETTPSPGRAGRGLTQMGLPIPRDAPAGRPDPAPWGHGPRHAPGGSGMPSSGASPTSLCSRKREHGQLRGRGRQGRGCPGHFAPPWAPERVSGWPGKVRRDEKAQEGGRRHGG